MRSISLSLFLSSQQCTFFSTRFVDSSNVTREFGDFAVSFEYAPFSFPLYYTLLSMVYYSCATITQSIPSVPSSNYNACLIPNSHSLLCPVLLILLLQQLSILLLIRPQPGGVRIQRRIVIRLSQQTLNGQQNRPHVIRRRPFLFQNIQTNIPKLIDVWVETRGGKFHHRRFERVLVRKRQRQRIFQVFVRSTFGAFDGADPAENVITVWERRNTRVRGGH